MINRKFASLILFSASALFGQYKMETLSTPPEGVAPAVAGLLDKQGTKIMGPNGQVYCEIWFRSTPPPAAQNKEISVTWNTVAHGSLIGVINFPAQAADRRGQIIKPGVYTLRFSYYPTNGDHQGVAPQRDFLILSKASEDADANSTPKFDDLMAMSRKASGTPHPLVLSMWKGDSDWQAGFDKMGETDWVLQTTVAGTKIAVILVGKAEG
jgi:hypothetical protein